MRDCNSKSAKEFTYWQLQNRVPAVHVLYDLNLRLDSLAPDRQFEENTENTHDMGFVDKKVSDLEIFDSLGDDDGSAAHTNKNFSTTRILEKLDSSSATHRIASQMRLSQVLLVGNAANMPCRSWQTQTTSYVNITAYWHETQKRSVFKIGMQLAALKGNTTTRFEFCVDTSAPTSVVGLKELRGIRSMLKKKIYFRPSTKNSRFADATYEYLGTIDIALSTLIGIPKIYVKLDDVSADVPAFLGFDV